MAERVDEAGAAFAGSQLQTQIWVNKRPKGLADEVGGLFGDLDGGQITWVSPVRREGFREYQDSAFLRQVGLDRLRPELSAFWPAGGPAWDGLGVVDAPAGPGVVLLEGKSYPQELRGSGCQAGPVSRPKIHAALAATQEWLGVDRTPEDWCGPLYQTANRLAHLFWLNEVVGVDAWMVHLLFTNDQRSPTSQQTWLSELEAADQELGLPSTVPRTGHAILEAGDRFELIGAG